MHSGQTPTIGAIEVTVEKQCATRDGAVGPLRPASVADRGREGDDVVEPADDDLALAPEFYAGVGLERALDLDLMRSSTRCRP